LAISTVPSVIGTTSTVVSPLRSGCPAHAIGDRQRHADVMSVAGMASLSVMPIVGQSRSELKNCT